MAIQLLVNPDKSTVSPMITIRTKHVPFNPNKGSGDWHVIEGRIELSADYIKKLCSAAGIRWDFNRCTHYDANLIVWESQAYVLKEDMTKQEFPGSYELDLEAKRDEIRIKWLKKSKAGEKVNGQPIDIELETMSEMISWRKNKRMRAETGAIKRAVKGLLGLGKYTLDELKDGFDVQSVVFTPDFSNPLVQQYLIQKAYEITAPQISAPATQRPALPAPVTCNNGSDDDIIEAETKEIESHEQTKPQTQVEKPAEQVKAAETKSVNTSAAGSNGKHVCKNCKNEVSLRVAEKSQERFGLGEIFCYPVCQNIEAGRRQAEEANIA